MDLDAAVGEVLVGREDVGMAGVAAEREDGRVLQEKKRVANAPLLAGFDDTPLNLKRLRERDAAEMEKVDQHAWT